MDSPDIEIGDIIPLYLTDQIPLSSAIQSGTVSIP